MLSTNIEMTFSASSFALLNPSEYSNTSAINSLSGTLIATGLNNCFKLSGNLDLPPYPFPAGLRVTKIPALQLTSIFFPKSSKFEDFSFIAHYIIYIY